MSAVNEESHAAGSSVRSPRFVHWVAFLVFSLITLGSSIDAADRTGGNSSRQRWAIACSSVNFAINAIVVFMHLSQLSSVYIVGTKVEGIFCVILIAFWSATVAIISDNANGLAVDDDGAVSNGNLYYFSWAGFVCSITLGVSYLRSVYSIDVTGEIRSRSARLTLWAALLAACLVVMGSSANIFDNDCTTRQANQTAHCRRTKLGVSLGCIGVMICLVVIAMKIATSMAPFLFEAGSGLTLFLCFIFGVAYITAEAGPGSPLGNLYYSTWASCVLSFMIGSSCYEDYLAAKAMSAHQATVDASSHDLGLEREDVRVDSLDAI